MGLKIYRGEAFENTHENHFFDYLCDALTLHCDDLSHDWHLLGNVHVGSRELDALLIKPNAVIALDFKDYGGKLKFSEAGPWEILTPEGQDLHVKGGASVNPFVQLKKNKRALADFFQRQFSDLDCNWGHIAAAVVFQQPIDMEYGAVPGHLNRWFHITDQINFVRDLENIVSRSIRFDYDDQAQIPVLLGIGSYKVPKIPNINTARGTAVIDGGVGVDTHAGEEPSARFTNSQIVALTQFESWLNSTNDVFQLNGMADSGKRELLTVLQSKAAAAGYLVQFVVPSKRIARRYSNLGIDVTSIYTYLYSLYPNAIEQNGNQKIAIHQLNIPENISDSIIFVLDAHLFSDSELQESDRRYGSGRLITDFLKVIREHGGRLVSVGDPYQLSRAGEESSLVHTNVYMHHNLSVSSYELNEQITQQTDSALNRLRLDLVKAIKSSRFNRLCINSGKQLTVIDRAHDSWKPNIVSDLPYSIMLAPTKIKSRIYNDAVKSKLLGHSNNELLAKGDWIDFYNRTPILVSSDDIQDPFLRELHNGSIRWIDAGSIGKIICVLDRESVVQPLRGRKEQIQLNFACLRVVVQGLGEVECRCLLNFTLSIDNKLTPDEKVALSIVARDKAKDVLAERKAQLPDSTDPQYKEA